MLNISVEMEDVQITSSIFQPHLPTTSIMCGDPNDIDITYEFS